MSTIFGKVTLSKCWRVTTCHNCFSPSTYVWHVRCMSMVHGGFSHLARAVIEGGWSGETSLTCKIDKGYGWKKRKIQQQQQQRQHKLKSLLGQLCLANIDVKQRSDRSRKMISLWFFMAAYSGRWRLVRSHKLIHLLSLLAELHMIFEKLQKTMRHASTCTSAFVSRWYSSSSS